MKKFLPLVFLLLFACHVVPEKTAVTPKTPVIKDPKVSKSEDYQESATHDQFESGNLITPKDQEKKTKVALLLPFSGKNKDLGWSLFNAATMSIFDNDHNHVIELVLVDSKETQKDAEEAFKNIVKQEIKIVIGPVFSDSIPAIDNMAKRNGITVLSLSNNQELAQNIGADGGLFIAGILPETQIDRIVEYSLETGKTNFAIIAPNSQYGRTISSLFSRIARDRDGNVITSQYYDSSGQNIEKTVERAINSFSVPSDLMRNKGKFKKGAVIGNNDRIYPQVIFVPEAGRMMSKIAAAIKQLNKDERDFQIVGTSQWDDVKTMNDTNLFGAWFPAPDNNRFRNFERSYYNNFGKFPPRISSLAYDLTAVAIELSNLSGRLKSPTINDFINYKNPPINGFDGVDGTFRFLPNGLTQRNLAILQVGSGKFDTIDLPASGFLNY